MNFGDNYRLWASNLPIQALRERVLSFTEDDWSVNDKDRNERFKTHAATQSIPIMWDPDLRHRHSEKPALERHRDVFGPILSQILALFPPGSQIIRCLLARLRSDGEIPAHHDPGWSLPYAHRMHLPLVTFPEVTFTVGGETKVFKEGELWEINNQRTHTVKNGSPHGRIQLITDISTPELEARRDADILRFKDPMTMIINNLFVLERQGELSNPALVELVRDIRKQLRNWQVDNVFAGDYRDSSR